MHTGAGVGLIVAGAALAVLTAFGLLRVLPAAAVLALAALAGLAVGSGALLVQDHAGGADWAVTLPVLGLLTPTHVWLVFRPLGRPARG